MNLVLLSGKIVGNLELESTNKGNLSYIKFKLANKRESKYNKTVKENINCIVWNDLAKYMYKEFKAGDYILVQGYVSSKDHSFEDGRTFNTTEIVVKQIEEPDITNPYIEETGAI